MRKAIIIFVLLPFLWVSPLSASTFTLGEANNFGIFGLSGSEVELVHATVNGDVAVGPGGILDFRASSTVNGDIFVDSSATIKKFHGAHTGALLTEWELGQATTDAIQAANTAASMIPTDTFSSLGGDNQTITGTGGWNIINVTDIAGQNSVTLEGGPDDVFIFNVFGEFDLKGSAQISGVDPSRVLINIIGPGIKEVSSKQGTLIEGTVLAVDRSLDLYSVHDSVIGGMGGTITLKSTNSLTQDNFNTSAVPIPSGIFLLGSGLLGLMGLRRKAKERHRAPVK